MFEQEVRLENSIATGIYNDFGEEVKYFVDLIF